MTLGVDQISDIVAAIEYDACFPLGAAKVDVEYDGKDQFTAHFSYQAIPRKGTRSMAVGMAPTLLHIGFAATAWLDFDSEEEVLLWIHAKWIEAVTHEASEGLRYKGTLPFDPHRPEP